MISSVICPKTPFFVEVYIIHLTFDQVMIFFLNLKHKMIASILKRANKKFLFFLLKKIKDTDFI